ncbi:hypothetical protein WP4W18E08_18450 [Escherichia coli]|nr:hypothetical protein WP4W18E08_18450 [Escherichia coli]
MLDLSIILETHYLVRLSFLLVVKIVQTLNGSKWSLLQ